MPCARTRPPVYVLCRWGKKLVILCPFVHKTKNSRWPVFPTGLTTYDFFFRRFFRVLMKLVAAMWKAVCLISLYKSQWTRIGAMWITGLVIEVHVLGTSYTRLDGLWFLLLRIREAFGLSRKSADRWWNSLGVSWTVIFSCVTIMKAHEQQLALFSNELACA